MVNFIITSTSFWMLLLCQEGTVTPQFSKLRERQGVILSPNYPQKYDKQTTCLWQIHPLHGGRIVLYFNDFDLPDDWFCYDHLSIFDGNIGLTALINDACGSTLKHSAVVSSESRVFVYFESNFESSKGFNITWTACGGDFIGLEGNVTSEELYFSYTDFVCTYNFMIPDNNSAVEIEILSDLQSYTGECLIQIVDNKNSVVGKICQENDTRRYVSETHTIAVQFKMVYGSNVTLKVAFKAYECSFSLLNKSGYFESPDYPSYFERNSFCDYEFSFIVPENQLLKIQFDDINMPCNGSDRLVIITQDTTNKTNTTSVCADYTLNTMFLSNKIKLRFRSTADNHSARFAAHYSTVGIPRATYITESTTVLGIVAVVVGVVVTTIIIVTSIVTFYIFRLQRKAIETDVIANLCYESVIPGEAETYTEASKPSNYRAERLDDTDVYHGTSDGEYDYLRRSRPKVTPEKGDNLYGVIESRADVYNNTDPRVLGSKDDNDIYANV